MGFLEQAEAFSDKARRASKEKIQDLFRFTIAFCLVGILFMGISPPINEKSLVSSQSLETESSLTGVGGGYLENSINDEPLEVTVSLDTVVLEPDFISGPRMLLFNT